MVKIKFSAEAKEIYDFLKEQAPKSKKACMILNSLTGKLGIIQKNPHYGNPINKRLIPSYYEMKYSL